MGLRQWFRDFEAAGYKTFPDIHGGVNVVNLPPLDTDKIRSVMAEQSQDPDEWNGHFLRLRATVDAYADGRRWVPTDELVAVDDALAARLALPEGSDTTAADARLTAAATHVAAIIDAQVAALGQ